MWITDEVELPDAVLDAQNSGKLVFFVGAGASMDAPSSLPSFKFLAEKLAGLAEVEFDKQEHIDTFLGSLPGQFDTHRHTAKLIKIDGSEPNSTHKAIVSLAGVKGSLRVVTTNFDTHLSKAADDLGIDIPEVWHAPAMPLGDDFEGIVHIHGSVDAQAKNLVLTDSDFGRAYLTNAWATRFLNSMFHNFTVVFIGYSHDDLIMKYLALGLPKGTSRFAFTGYSAADERKKNKSKWKRLGITSIDYPITESKHHALVEALEKWAKSVRMGRTEHRERISDVFKGGTGNLTPVDQDYLKNRLKQQEGVEDFIEAASSQNEDLHLQWLTWMEEDPVFQNLFEGIEDPSVGPKLCEWFSNTYISKEKLNRAALRTVAKLGQKFSPSLYSEINDGVTKLYEQNAEDAQRWQVFLASSIEGISAPTPIPSPLLWNTDDKLLRSWAMLRDPIRPMMKLDLPIVESEDRSELTIPYMKLRWCLGTETLRNCLESVAKSSDLDRNQIGSLLESILEIAYFLQASYSGTDFDYLGYFRFAIEPHPQDSLNGEIDVVVDALRDFGEKADSEIPTLIKRWWGFGQPLFQRIAIHLLNHADEMSPDEKLQWLLDRNLLYQSETKHEVYGVLKSVVPNATEKLRTQLLDAAVAGIEIDESTSIDNHEKMKYNLLNWLVRKCDESWDQAKKALEKLQGENSDFEPGECLDLNHYWIIEGWQNENNALPDTELFISQLKRDVPGAINTLFDLKAQLLPSRFSFVADNYVQKAVKEDPELGIKIWDFLDKELPEERSADATYFKMKIIRAWSNASLSESFDNVFSRIRSVQKDVDFIEAISSFLHEQVDHLENSNVEKLRWLAFEIWENHTSSVSHYDPATISETDHVFWASEIVRYWEKEVSRRWQHNQENWEGFDDEEKRAFNDFLEIDGPLRKSTISELASSLYFLFAADPEYVKSNLIPLFSNGVDSLYCWENYLYHPRCSNKLLEEGFFGAVKHRWEYLKEISSEELQRQFLRLTVLIAMYSGISDEERRDLLGQGIVQYEGEFAPKIAETVLEFCREKPENISEMWESWLREWVGSRIDGIPREASPEELARWMDIVPFLGKYAQEGIDLIETNEIGFEDGMLIDNDLKNLQDELLFDYLRIRIDKSFFLNSRIKYIVGMKIEELKKIDQDKAHELEKLVGEKPIQKSPGWP
ncbi:SIR2-like domain [Corynebacterium mustelae]|uniref:SIR2-like domain n=1 Tax=Corynebacterium mustelae TaxID=571915 RepID=A0A0G3GZY5_9CORY|nr:SIR2 family protein [Corynebacterium mustelae]AKK04412.1 SIR2-like domain [Corynebacterium mustelae]